MGVYLCSHQRCVWRVNDSSFTPPPPLSPPLIPYLLLPSLPLPGRYVNGWMRLYETVYMDQGQGEYTVCLQTRPIIVCVCDLLRKKILHCRTVLAALLFVRKNVQLGRVCSLPPSESETD